MATLELEADFVKGLRLMFSTSRDAPDALRNMLDEAIRAKYGSSKSLGTFQPTKIKVEEEFTSSHMLTDHNSDDSNASKDDDSALDLEMMEYDLSCAVCRGMNVGSRNRLVECLECNALYHQECHRPAIQDQEISDPRVAWYCSTCSRNMHRPAPVEPPPTSSKQSSSKSSSSKTFKSSSSSRDSPTNTKPSSSSSRSESSSQSLFKRTEKSSTSSSSTSSSSHKSAPSGLAALAASLQPSSKSSSSGGSSHKSSNPTSSSSKNSSSSHTSSSSKNFSTSGSSSSQTNKGSPSSPTLSGLNADRRLQNMKKKAAAKIQEKRKHSK